MAVSTTMGAMGYCFGGRFLLLTWGLLLVIGLVVLADIKLLFGFGAKTRPLNRLPGLLLLIYICLFEKMGVPDL